MLYGLCDPGHPDLSGSTSGKASSSCFVEEDLLNKLSKENIKICKQAQGSNSLTDSNYATRNQIIALFKMVL